MAFYASARQAADPRAPGARRPRGQPAAGRAVARGLQPRRARGARPWPTIDAAITNGPGLRWAVVGPFAGQHLSGGRRRHRAHPRAPRARRWSHGGTTSATPAWTPGARRARRRADARRDGRPTTSDELVRRARPRSSSASSPPRRHETDLTRPLTAGRDDMTGMTLDLDALVAIDVHTHAEISEDGHVQPARRAHGGVGEVLQEHGDGRTPTLDAARRALPRAAHGRGRLHRRRRAPDRPPADPQRRRRCAPRSATPTCSSRSRASTRTAATAGVAEARRLVDGAWRARVQVPPDAAGLLARRPRWPTRSTRRSRSSAYRRCSTAGRPGSAPGMPGGGGLRLRHSNPMLLDDVAADFPDLTIIIAHPSFPWQDEALVGRDAQGERLHRPVGLVAEVLPAAARAVRQHAAQAQGALRLRLPA